MAEVTAKNYEASALDIANQAIMAELGSSSTRIRLKSRSGNVLSEDSILGPKGAKGATGAKGETGAPGDTGATGPTGDVGDKGATGATGDKGATGETSSDWPRLLLVGSVGIPSVAGQWVSVDIELPAVWGTSIPIVVAQARTSVPGTSVAYLGVSTSVGLITIKSFRTSGTSHSVYFTAMEEG